MNFYYDRQSLAQGGFSFDIGTMLDVLVHVTDPDVDRGNWSDAKHQKLPVIGCFRSSPSYKAWGVQMGLHAVEIASGVAAWYGHAEVGVAAIAATRAIGLATLYRTDLQRRSLFHLTFRADHPILAMLGFSQVTGQIREASTRRNGVGLHCRDLL